MRVVKYDPNSPPETQKVVQVTMQEEEAQAILGIFRKIGGSPSDTRRKHVDEFNRAFYRDVPDIRCHSDDIEGSMYFKKQKENDDENVRTVS